MHKNAKLHVPGERYGLLVLIEQDPKRGNRGRIKWICRCDCGTIKSVVLDNLTTGHSTSCGCQTRARSVAARTSHGLAGKVPEYNTWKGMRRRCLSVESGDYKGYGGRGITICPEWSSFDAFYRDMGPRPSPSHSLDRIDNSGPYSPENCRWATSSAQARNRRSGRMITHAGKTQTLTDWAEETGIPHTTIRRRLDYYGWSVADALTHRPLRRS